MIQYSKSLEELDWIPRPKLTALRRLEIETVEDLLTHFPRRYEDRTHFAPFPREESDAPLLVCGEVVKTRLVRFGGDRKSTRLNSSHDQISYAVFCLKKKKKKQVGAR